MCCSDQYDITVDVWLAYCTSVLTKVGPPVIYPLLLVIHVIE